MKVIEEIVLDFARVQLLAGAEVVRLEIFGELTIGRTESKEMNDAIGLLSKGREILVLILAEDITSFNKEAMEFSASEEGLRYTIGDALVVRSVANRITANFYLAVNKPQKPSKIFNSETEALKWLYSLIGVEDYA